jgi:hypothetical protein
MAIEWSNFAFGPGNSNGMRVGIDFIGWSAVSNGSTTVTATMDIYTENTFAYSNDNQTLTYTTTTSNLISFSGTKDYVNNQAGGISTKRHDNKTGVHAYGVNSYGGSPGNVTFKVSVSDAFSGANPTKTITVAIPARPGTAPGAPGVTSTPGDGIVTIGYSAPASAGQPTPITDYQWSSTGADDSFMSTVGTNPFNVVGTNGTAKTIYIRARNQHYIGSATSATSTPFGPPSAPTNVSSSPNNGSITVSFGAPTSNNGKAITYYEYSTNNVNFTQIFTNPFNVPGTNGTALTVYVRAGNGDTVGTSAGSSVSTTSTPRTVPSEPTSFSANASTLGQITLSWAAPSSNGGNSVSSYVLRNGGTVLQNTSATSYTHTGLSPNTTYSYTVTAANGAGEGAASSVSATTLGGRVKIWDGSSWVTIFPQVWNGSAWVTAQARIWTGTEWKFGL